MFYFVKVL